MKKIEYILHDYVHRHTYQAREMGKEMYQILIAVISWC